jgi:hypothetical protein
MISVLFFFGGAFPVSWAEIDKDDMIIRINEAVINL